MDGGDPGSQLGFSWLAQLPTLQHGTESVVRVFSSSSLVGAENCRERQLLAVTEACPPVPRP